MKAELKELYQKLYEEAKVREDTRPTDWHTFSAESVEGFMHGLNAVFDPDFVVDYERIKSGTAYGYAFVAAVCAKQEAVKGKGYKASWQKKGEAGALANVQRKTDRLEAGVEAALGLLGPAKALTGEESLCETLGDNHVYNGKWAVLRNEINPEEFKLWVERVRNES